MSRGLLRAHPTLRPNFLESLRTALAGLGGDGAPVGASYVTINVEGGLTAEYVLGTSVIMYGPVLSRPAASKAGLIYIESDAPYRVWRDNGASWDEVARGEAGIRLAQLAERAHASTTGRTANDHHAQVHTLASHSTKAHTELTGVTAEQHHLKNISQRAASTGDLTLAVGVADVPGATLSLGAGTWLVFGVFNFGVQTYALKTCYGHLDVGGALQPSQARWVPVGGDWEQTTCTQAWRITLGGTTTVKLRGSKNAAGGTHFIYSPHTAITALRTGD